LVGTGTVGCGICRLPIDRGQKWHLHHAEDGSLVPAHAVCNGRHGAVQGQPAAAPWAGGW
jgi:hypothetical protein